MSIQNISVIGAGTMGHGIALVFAMHGYPVSLYEPFAPVREAALGKIRTDLEFLAGEDYIPPALVEETLGRVALFGGLADAVAEADYVLEATPEKLELKQDLFGQLDRLCPAHTVLASNTSSLVFSDMTAQLPPERKARTMVCHWYNPAHLLPIAELSCFGNMPEALFQEIWDLYVKCEKQPVKVVRDIPGLVANRLLHAQAREAFHLIEMGAAAPEDIDRALKYGPGFRSATTGLLEVADLGGLDIWCAAEDNLFPALDDSTRASDALRQKVEAGRLGLKNGAGFFDYSAAERERVQLDFYRRLVVQLKASREYA